MQVFAAQSGMVGEGSGVGDLRGSQLTLPSRILHPNVVAGTVYHHKRSPYFLTLSPPFLYIHLLLYSRFSLTKSFYSLVRTFTILIGPRPFPAW